MTLKLVRSFEKFSTSIINYEIKYMKRLSKGFCTSVYTTQEKENETYDIVISGGGMVGFSMGCALGQSKRLEGKKILVLEKQPKRPWKLPEEFSNRVCALNPQTQNLFSKLGVWDLVVNMRAQPVRKMQVWESCTEALISFEDQEQKRPVAHIVENDVILEALKNKIPNNVEVLYGSSVSGYELPSSGDEKVLVILQDGKKFSADLLIGADGAHSGIRKAMDCKYLNLEYDQTGIVATLQLSEEHDNFTAWQKFLSTGPVAILPLSSSRSSLVWSTTKERARRLMSLSEMDFIDALNNSLWRDEKIDPLVKFLHERWQNVLQSLISPAEGSLGTGARQLPSSISGVVPKSRASFPLGLGHAAHYVAPRVALIGDAAHRVHPLAGQGVNLGFGDVACLLDTIENAVFAGLDIGDLRELQNYETKRQRHNVASMVAIDGLYRLYSTKFAPFVLLRSIGLSAVDVFQPIKKRIMMHASS